MPSSFWAVTKIQKLKRLVTFLSTFDTFAIRQLARGAVRLRR